MALRLEWTRAPESCDNTFKITWVVSLSIIAWVAFYLLHHLSCEFCCHLSVEIELRHGGPRFSWQRDEGPDTEVDKLDKFDAKLGQFSDRFEKSESAILALSSRQLSSQDKGPVGKGVEPKWDSMRHRRTKTNQRPGLAWENLHPKSSRGRTLNRAQMEKF